MVEHVVLVHGDRGHAVDGIRDYTNRLAETLAALGQHVEVRAQPPANPITGVRRAFAEARELRGLGPKSAVILQYSPFCFARWGFAPWLPLWALVVRSGRQRPKLALMVHEPFVPMTGWKWRLMGLWQRFQLSALRAGADVLFASITSWAALLDGSYPRRLVHHLPVGSNLPDRRAERDKTRKRLAIGEGAVVVAALGRDHPSWMSEYVVVAANAIVAEGKPIVLLALGAEAPPLNGLDDRVELHAPGFLEADELACHLAAADLFLAPLIDGVSTRRGALMAALQQGLPVVGTSGRLTDPILHRCGGALRLTEVGAATAFAEAAATLAARPADCESAGAEARRLYVENFDWPVIAERMLASLGDR